MTRFNLAIYYLGLVAWVLSGALLANCCGSSSLSPCERWLMNNECFVGAAVEVDGRPVLVCLDGETAEKFERGNERIVNMAACGKGGRVFDATESQCWEPSELVDYCDEEPEEFQAQDNDDRRW